MPKQQLLLLLLIADVIYTTQGWNSPRQISTFQSHHASLAIDGDPDTCAISGRDRHPWWIQTNNTPLNVTNVKIKINIGNDPLPSTRLRVRVGDGEDIEGDDAPEPPLDLCAEWLGPFNAGSFTLACKQARTGTSVIVEVIADQHVHMALCELQINV